MSFAAPSDPRHANDAESFIERLLPNLYLINFALDKVLEREQSEPNNLKRFCPPADLPQLKLFAERAPHRFENFSEDFAVWVFFYGPLRGEEAG